MTIYTKEHLADLNAGNFEETATALRDHATILNGLRVAAANYLRSCNADQLLIEAIDEDLKVLQSHALTLAEEADQDDYVQRNEEAFVGASKWEATRNEMAGAA